MESRSVCAPGRVAVVALAGLALAALGGCGSGSAKSSGGGASTGSALKGPLTVFGAASLTESLNAEKATLRRGHPELALTFSFAGSQLLAQQILQGAPADVFASADAKNMQKLVDAKLVESPRVFARNKLEIAVARGNPKHVTGLGDLARSDLVVVLADPSVPAGNYSRQALVTAAVAVHPKSLELDVKSALAKVTSGEADATIVYVSDVRSAGAAAEGVVMPDSENIMATYTAAVVKSTTHMAAAQAFLGDLVSGSGRDALVEHGFLPAS
jgi:molybdate transport system substrate-binding protein